MNGLLLMKCLMVVYAIIGLVFLYEKDYARAWYWAAALQITGSVLWMK